MITINRLMALLWTYTLVEAVQAMFPGKPLKAALRGASTDELDRVYRLFDPFRRVMSAEDTESLLRVGAVIDARRWASVPEKAPAKKVA